MIVAAATALVALGACSSNSGGGGALSPQASVVLKSMSTSTLDKVLAEGDGHILYGNGQEAGAVLACDADCLTMWPVVTVKSAAAVHTSGSGLRSDLIGTIAGSHGGRIVTYGGYPLHVYAGDSKAPGSGEGIAGYSAVGLDGLLVRIPAARVAVPTSTP